MSQSFIIEEELEKAVGILEHYTSALLLFSNGVDKREDADLAVVCDLLSGQMQVNTLIVRALAVLCEDVQNLRNRIAVTVEPD